jgi:hypothetical protein
MSTLGRPSPGRFEWIRRPLGLPDSVIMFDKAAQMAHVPNEKGIGLKTFSSKEISLHPPGCSS